MRKALAGSLIRLAHRIYPPRVTEGFTYREFSAKDLPTPTRRVYYQAGNGGRSRGWN